MRVCRFRCGRLCSGRFGGVPCCGPTVPRCRRSVWWRAVGWGSRRNGVGSRTVGLRGAAGAGGRSCPGTRGSCGHPAGTATGGHGGPGAGPAGAAAWGRGAGRGPAPGSRRRGGGAAADRSGRPCRQGRAAGRLEPAHLAAAGSRRDRAGPKELARVARFQGILARLGRVAAGGESLAEAAASAATPTGPSGPRVPTVGGLDTSRAGCGVAPRG